MKLMTRFVAATLVVGLALASVSQAEARLLKKAEELPNIGGPAPAMVAPVPGAAVISYSAAAALAAPCCQPACCPNPCIKYRNAIFDCKVRCCDPCKPPISACLHVKNPCTCCAVDVPVCLPSCCCGEPTVCCSKALLGDSVVTYTWCCGFSTSVKFKKCGDVLVTYRGN